MPLDIPGIAVAGLDKIWTVAESALSDATVKLNPFVTPAADGGSAVTTWGQSISCKVFKYDAATKDTDEIAKEQRGATARTVNTRIIVRASDLSGNVPNSDTQVVIGSETWEVHEVQHVPTEPFFILHCR